MPIIGLGQLTLTDLNDAIISGTPPQNPTDGMLWIDENYSPKLLKKWNGTSWIVIGEVMDEGTGETIEDITETLGNMANDNKIDYSERKVIKDKLTDILGYVITDATASLPTQATLDSSAKGGFYTVRKSALNAGLLSSDAKYIDVKTKYDALKTYLDGLTPIKSWDLSVVNQDVVIDVTKSTFRDKWLQYYLAVDALATATADKLRQNVEDVEVGGRNFVSNGDFAIDLVDARYKDNYFGNVKEITDISAEKPPFQFALHINNTANTNGGIFTPIVFDGEVAEVLLNKEITVSYWLKYQNIVQGTNSFNAGRFGELEIEGTKSDGTKVYSYYRIGATNVFGSAYTLGTNMTWNKYDATLKVALPSGAIKISKISFKHGLEGCKGEFWTTGLKLEIGNKVTDWSPDPLDAVGTVTHVVTKVLKDRIIQMITSSETYTQDKQNLEDKVAKILTLKTSSNLMTFDENDNFKPVSQIISITAEIQNLTGNPTFTAIPYDASGNQQTAIVLEGTGIARALRTTHWKSNFARVVVEASLGGYTDSVTIVKVKDGVKGDEGNAGKDAITGFLTNESITLPANSSGTVSNFTTATGTFEVYDGIVKKTGTGVAYLKTLESGCTASINATTGVYSVTAMSTDQATATFTATYGGVVITKVLSLSKSKQGGIGATGKGVSSIVEEYYLSTSATAQENGSWSTTAPTWSVGKYIWTRSKTTYTDSTTATTTPICTTGKHGSDGSDGLGISKVDVQYYLSTSATALAGGSWSTTAPTWQQDRYMWSKTVTTYTNSTTSESTPICISGSKGDTGASGKGVTSIVEEYYLSTSSTTQTGGSWVTTVPTWADGKFMWTRSKITYTDSTSTTTSPVNVTGAKGSTGDDGTGVSSVDVEYYLSTSASALSGGSWVTTSPAWADGKYIWSRTKTVYTSGSTTYSNPACITGAKGNTGNDGKGVSSATVTYQNHTNGATAPTGTWSSTVPTVVQGQYLWTRTITAYTDSSSVTTYSVSYNATDGQKGNDGKGVKSTAITYQLHTNGTTAPTGTWVSSPPTPIQGRYLWTRTIITYTDNSTSTSYSTSYYATDGQDGNDGKGVTSIVEQYYHSTSATSLAGGSWSTTVPTWANNKYVWTKAVTTFTDGSTSETSAVNVTGSKGTDGTQRYTWVRYADDANGNGMADTPDGKRYIGIAVNQTSATEGGTASAYTWSPLYDNVEIGGRNLALIANWTQWGTGDVTRTKYSYVLNSTTTSGVGISQTSEQLALMPNKQYVFSFKVRMLGGTLERIGGHTDTAFSTKMFFKIDGVEQNVGFSSPINVTALNDGNWHTIEYSFKTPATITVGNRLYIQPNRAVYTVGVVEVKDLQIEQSNIASDWRPAPEDIQEEIDSKADNSVIETLTTEYGNQLTETASEIISTMTETIKTEDGKVIEAYRKDIDETARSWNLSFTEVTESVEGLNGEMTEVKTYFDFSSDGLGIGKSDSPLQVVIDNNSLQFLNNGGGSNDAGFVPRTNAVAYINGKMMYIESLEVLSYLLVGNHKIEKYNSEITLVKYSG
jgi:hypothetical protein